MRRLGLIGGTSWVSTMDYYRLLNEGVQQRLGGHHSADLLVHSLDFQRVLDDLDHPQEIEATIAAAGRGLVAAGCELLALASNTGHKYAHRLLAESTVPVLHIGEATSTRLSADGRSRVGVLGTRLTLEDDALVAALVGESVEAVTPSAGMRERLDAVIFADLAHGTMTPRAHALLDDVQRELAAVDVDAVLLACTELTFASEHHTLRLTAYDTTRLHCEALVDATLFPR